MFKKFKKLCSDMSDVKDQLIRIQHQIDSYRMAIRSYVADSHNAQMPLISATNHDVDVMLGKINKMEFDATFKQMEGHGERIKVV